jgi:multidrug efflux system outer membrane protein
MMRSERSTLRFLKTSASVLIVAALSASCTVGPDYEKPEISLPDHFRAQISTAEATSIADLPWWQVFDDRVLQGLISASLANNYDLQIAVSRVAQARAMLGVAASEGQPQVGYGAVAGGQNALVPGKGKVQDTSYAFAGGVLNAAWELDIWGRIKHATDAARAHMLAQDDVRRAVILTLVSDIAAGYFRLLELDRELAIAEESSKVYKKTFDLFRYRFEAGRDSKLASQRAEAAYDTALADIQDLKRLIAQQENAISVLVGAYPGPIARGHALEQQTLPRTPLGSTTALLQRRPEILAAEQNMVGANAEIGEAVANFFPRIGLSALFGGQGIAIGGAWQGFSVWSAALSMAGPIFSGDRLTSEYHEKQAYWDETVATYKAKVLVAFQETADALAAQQTLDPRRAALQSKVRALQESSDLALLRYDAGRASYFEVLEAQQQLFPAQDQLAQAERDRLLAVVSLYKALGGGWGPEAGEQKPPPPATAGTTPNPGKTGG